MHRQSILLIIGLLAATSVQAEAYRWVDEDGVVHYSDRPQEGAEVVELSEYSRDTGARLYRDRTPSDAADDEPEAAGPFRYESLSIVAPGAEETLWNIDGVLSVSLALSPSLQSGHRVRVYFDGQEQMMSSSTSFQIEEVFRGVHNVQAEVIDAAGQLMIRSKPNRFYVQQNTVNLGGR